MSSITTHILDTSCGQPAAGVAVTLALFEENSWTELGSGKTNVDGRLADLLAPGSPAPGIYRLRFEMGAYFRERATDTFYPWAEIVFRVTDGTQHYHVPLLINPFGYSTYRGS